MGQHLLENQRQRIRLGHQQQRLLVRMHTSSWHGGSEHPAGATTVIARPVWAAVPQRSVFGRLFRDSRIVVIRDVSEAPAVAVETAASWRSATAAAVAGFSPVRRWQLRPVRERRNSGLGSRLVIRDVSKAPTVAVEAAASW